MGAWSFGLGSIVVVLCCSLWLVMFVGSLCWCSAAVEQDGGGCSVGTFGNSAPDTRGARCLTEVTSTGVGVKWYVVVSLLVAITAAAAAAGPATPSKHLA